MLSKYKFSLLISLCLLCKNNLNAQNSFTIGGGMDIIDAEFSSTYGVFALFPSINLGKDFSLLPISENIGITLTPNIGVGIAVADVLLAQIYNSTYLSLRYGYLSTKKSGKDFGIGIGIGFRSAAGVIDADKFKYSVPSLNFEISFYSDYLDGIRFEYAFKGIDNDYLIATQYYFSFYKKIGN